ncbi:hypothetical protein ACHAXR_011586 [Thalassiosira sp. AJA248-18]
MSCQQKTRKKQLHSKSSSFGSDVEGKHDSFSKCISDRLTTLDLCSSYDECLSISETIAASAPVDSLPSEDDMENVVSEFLDYFEDVGKDDARVLIFAAAFDAWGEEIAHITNTVLKNVDGESDDSKNQIDDDNVEMDSEEDDGDFIGEGECELCERCIKLTRHHLIPKSTWPRMKKRLWNAAPVIESLHSLSLRKNKMGDEQQEQQLQEKKKLLQGKLGMANPSNLPTTITHVNVRAYLSQVCLLCRQCHSSIHRIHTEWELATQYNTMEQLLECEEVVKFGRWANKQRVSKMS